MLIMLDEQEVDFVALAEATEDGAGVSTSAHGGDDMDVEDGGETSEGSAAAATTASAGSSSGGDGGGDLMLGNFSFSNLSADGQQLVAAVGSNGGSGGYCEYIFRQAARVVSGALWVGCCESCT
jgi:hypothetical protein